MLGSRNQVGLTERQIKACQQNWRLLCGISQRTLDTTEASNYGSRTRFNETKKIVYLGADAYPSANAVSANARMSPLACLAHELAHAERFDLGFERPYKAPDSLLDEAETSIHASFVSILSFRDRADLIEDARDRLIGLQANTRNKMMQVEPSGVVLIGECEVQTSVCQAVEPAPITAVWTLPGRRQVNVCRACLDEKIRTGEWEAEGARAQRR